ncbi:MAG: hypothetical protein Kapaf2KO_13030 [Candidatus Kapaibacteriales bacterium]
MKRIGFLILLISVLASCELEQTVDTELDYEKQLVINGIIYADSAIANIYLERTLPPLQYEPRDSDFWVTDASVFISVNGIEYKLSNRDNEYYLPDSIIIPNVGDIIDFRAEWQGESATATTIIPPRVEVAYIVERLTNYEYGEESKDLLVGVSNDESYFTPELYRDEFGVLIKRQFYDFGNSSYITGKGRPSENEIFYRLGSPRSINILDYIEQNQWVIGAMTMTKDFVDYWDTRDDGYGGGDGIFGGGGRNPIWNIDGAIGLFVGANLAIIPDLRQYEQRRDTVQATYDDYYGW